MIKHLLNVTMLFLKENLVLEMKNADGLQVALRILTALLKLVKIGDQFQTDSKLEKQRLRTLGISVRV